MTRLVDLDTQPASLSDGFKYGMLAVSVLIPVVGLGVGLYFWIKGGSEENTALGRLWFFLALGVSVMYALLANQGY